MTHDAPRPSSRAPEPEGSRPRLVAPGERAPIVAALRAGEVVALPTETVYGLAARADDPDAVARIFAAKGRPADNPLIVHCADAEGAFALGVDVPAWARDLASAFWPGPITLVLRSGVAWAWVQAGHPTIAVRVPASAWLRELIAETGPLAAPSANRSGRPSPTTAAHCLADLGPEVALVVDGGIAERGVESTVVDCTGPAPVVLRPGPIPMEEIDRVAALGPDAGIGTSPGTRHPHYRPDAEVRLVDDAGGVDDDDGMLIAPVGETGGRAREERRWRDVADLGRHLYGWLREADEADVARVWVVRVPTTGLGRAVMDRLERAAGDRGPRTG